MKEKRKSRESPPPPLLGQALANFEKEWKRIKKTNNTQISH